MWLQHHVFGNFMSHNWKGYNDLELNLVNFIGKVSKWNKDTFGLVEWKKKHLLARLNGIQSSQSYPRSRHLRKLEIKLQRELAEILKLEEIKWFQKFRAEWIAKGDRDTRYYH